MIVILKMYNTLLKQPKISNFPPKYITQVAIKQFRMINKPFSKTKTLNSRSQKSHGQLRTPRVNEK